MLMVSIALVMAVVVTNIYLRKDSTKPVPYVVRRLFLHAPSTTSSASACRRTYPIRRRSARTVSAGVKEQTASRRRGSGPTTGKPARSRSASDPTSDGHQASLTDAEREDWQRLAKAVDRLFFWIFLVISIGCLIAMYIRSVSNRI